MNHFLQNYLLHHNQQQQHQHSGNLLGSGPMDWLLNTAAFAGADTLLNKVEDEEGKSPHVWRNAGLAGALALAYQWYRNHHQQQQQQQDPQYVYYPNNNSGYYYYPQLPTHNYYYYPPPQPQYMMPYTAYNQPNPYMIQQPSYMMPPNTVMPNMGPYYGSQPQQMMMQMMPYQHYNPRYPSIL
ncbi:hypothetical protein G6F46_000130 [Rhizopus delemar]|uniref:Uncharacterized protein n=3 Tax=Rhizopus TaxID=4842 RepID=I1BJM3_RHIO9|nr:hypothetical protein RO3G_01107 [Rhizopus delemar RA 99-880]KAG1445154.1 hypothetical protein G6F55_012064 [Rhizopus delemar]KAG1554047.1 hypothetical protein G6F51_000194 [Rhizopus arrhizus]KAG1499444.1 hypothetical protein G6F54_004400 [Rhizopus delemar]KAG1513225.1 hypothetical protein G6F53_004591 [Rhizopus delemar]|eukprot:EIE76403.1 hypothetical protein RO3G_01107 [Rhizopus delemar RA 99-880]